MKGRKKGVPSKKNMQDNRPSCHKCGGFMRSDGACGWRCTECAAWKEKDDSPRKKQDNEVFDWGFDTEKATEHARKCEKGKRLIVTTAQNNTDLHSEFFKALKQAAKYYNCEIAVIPSHYKNITSFSKAEEYIKDWDKAVQPYLVHTDIEFNNHLIRSDVRINSTTIWPLSGKNAHGGDRSVIFGHPQVSLEPVPTPADHQPKRLYTTGALTLPNYSVTDAGEKAKFHHCQGALILEKSRGSVFVRQLNCDDSGTFYDLDKRFTKRGVSEGHSILSIVCGDEHEKFNTVKKETYLNKTSIVKTLKPKYIVRHDILDGYAGSHHHEKDPMIQFKKFHNGDNDYKLEIDNVVKFINKTTPKGAKSLIVPSNHHDHFIKWLMNVNPNQDHKNALFALEMNMLMREACLRGEKYDPFYLYLKDRLTCEFEFLDRNEARLIGGVDVSQHGDVGTNGSRGSARGLARATYKMSIGHGHGARICQGVWQCGVSTGKLEYERGLSDHSNTHIIQYQNGKRCMIDIVDKRWRA